MAAYWKGGFCATIWCFFRKVIAINTVMWPKSPPSYLSHPLHSKNLNRRSFDTIFVFHLPWLLKGMSRWQQLLLFLYQREGWDLSRENLYLRKLSIFIVYLLRLWEGWTAVEGWTPCDELAPAAEVPGPAWPILPCPAWAPGCVGPAEQTGIQVGRPKGDGGLFETKWGGWGRGCPLISGVSTGPIKFLQFLNLSPFFSIGLSIKAQRGRTSGLPL